MMKFVDLAVCLMFVGSGLALVLMNLHVLFITSYSVTDPEISPLQKTRLAAECVLLVAAIAVVAIRAFRD